MCGCAEALLRAVVAFFDAVLVDCFLSWFRRRPGPDSPASAHRVTEPYLSLSLASGSSVRSCFEPRR
jgi:hypothetical protein